MAIGHCLFAIDPEAIVGWVAAFFEEDVHVPNFHPTGEVSDSAETQARAEILSCPSTTSELRLSRNQRPQFKLF